MDQFPLPIEESQPEQYLPGLGVALILLNEGIWYEWLRESPGI